MKKYLFLALAVFAFASCSKNLDVDGPIDASKNRLLQDGYWQLHAYTENPNLDNPGSMLMDLYPGVQACEKDNYYKFKDGGIVTMYDHYLKCFNSDPDQVDYNYVLSNNETHLSIFTDPSQPAQTAILDGDVTYPSIDSFIVTYQIYDSLSKQNQEFKKTYVKIIPN